MAYQDEFGTRAQQPIFQGVPKVFNINPSLNITRMWIEIDATVTITNGGGAGTPIGDAAIDNLAASRLIRHLQVLASPVRARAIRKGRW